MKNLFLSILCFFTISTSAQKPYTINGNIKNLTTGQKVFISYTENRTTTVDSCTSVNGRFTFKGIIAEPRFVQIHSGEEREQFYIEPGNIIISSAKGISSIVVSGTKTNVEYEALKLKFASFFELHARLNSEFEKFNEEEKADTSLINPLNRRYAKALEKMNEMSFKFAQDNPDSFVSLNILAEGLVYMPNYQTKLLPVYERFSNELKNSNVGVKLGLLIKSYDKTAIGAIAPDFSQNDPNGKTVKLSDFRGKYVLLDFWASWCVPCREDNPNLVAAYQKFNGRNFTILSVSLDGPKEKQAWLAAIAKDGLTWTHVSDLKSWKNEVALNWGVYSIPRNFLIGPDGKILAKGLHGDELEKKLSELLAEKH